MRYIYVLLVLLGLAGIIYLLKAAGVIIVVCLVAMTLYIRYVAQQILKAIIQSQEITGNNQKKILNAIKNLEER